MKKILRIILICLMIVSLIGCSQQASNQKSEEELREEIRAEMEAQAAKEAEDQAKREAEEKSKFENETTHGTYVNFNEYEAVIAHFYDGVNKDKLDIIEYNVGPKESFNVGTYTLQFAVFGKIENVRFDYHLGMFADPDPIFPIGTIENALVIVHAELPLDGAHIMVTGTVGGREIEFILYEWRMDPDVTPVEENIYKIAKE
ncbi:hypothetical protein SAMN05660297_02286 [Natronincola peptidivorans]|uniref:Lipoprotein n=1 Tax=Natronincola peptidivorans TaxID=426128 RepID=A0A1I0E5P9_9FIRM|nr:hypothetical protein [Natronincola peptidivorans]SET40313.1 hypothetical protein SAMN05660297_02286 [Natronincola peptidivorans]